VSDIYAVLEDGIDVPDDVAKEFGSTVGNLIQEQLAGYKESEKRPHTLRMSNVGKGARDLWYSQRDGSSFEPKPSDKIKFLYGHIIEELLLLLVKLSGHEVSEEQKEVKLNGIVGHIDCMIDGAVVDAKSTSPFAYDKFAKATILEEGNDPFGYIAQLSGYREALNVEEAGFLAMNKSTGEICFLEIDELTGIDTGKRINYLKKAMKDTVPPPRCYPDEADGKSGNMKIGKNCTFCRFKIECWSDTNEGAGLRKFKYARGYKYLTKVEREPKLEEVL
tara:strand:+ start:905 stop:1735 length:831 start_codon:yes stop_codon:yes gene_type:complete